MGELPWDLVFYGSMAMIFVGIMAGSAASRRKRGTDGSRGSQAGAAIAGDGKARASWHDGPDGSPGDRRGGGGGRDR